MTSHRMVTQCATCGYKGDRVGDIGRDGPAPGEGDVSLCIDCGSWGVFKADGTLRAATMAELMHLYKQPQAHALRRAWERVNAERRGASN